MPKATRREFARLAATLPLAATTPLTAQTPAPSPQPAQAAPAAAQPVPPLADALTGVVRAEFEPYLTQDDLTRIRADFSDLAGSYKRLRDFNLVNSDEPDFTFTVKATR